MPELALYKYFKSQEGGRWEKVGSTYVCFEHGVDDDIIKCENSNCNLYVLWDNIYCKNDKNYCDEICADDQ